MKFSEKPSELISLDIVNIIFIKQGKGTIHSNGKNKSKKSFGNYNIIEIKNPVEVLEDEIGKSSKK